MAWNLEEAISYYKSLGAPADQSALTALLFEVQRNSGGSVPNWAVEKIAVGLNTKESLILALIRRIPRLRLGDSHLLELCAGPNCGKHAALAAFAESLSGEKLTVRYIGCQRACGKGPNIRYDGKLYHRADETLLRELTGKT